MYWYTQCPQPCSRPSLTHASAGESWTSWTSLDQSLVGSLPLFPWSWCAQVSLCALQESISTVRCKFWQLYGGVNGNLLQEGLCDPKSAAPSHTQGICYPLQGRLLTPVFWPREFHGLYSPWGCKEWGMTEWLSLLLSFFYQSQLKMRADYQYM